MKKIVLSLLVAASLATLFGCNSRDEQETVGKAQIAELKPMQQSYRGELLCADCEGIDTRLFLEKDGTWVMNMAYEGVADPSPSASYGTWQRTADRLILTDSRGEKSYFQVKGDDLIMMNDDGTVSSPELFTLKPTTMPLPQTPMTMRGKYRYFADSATFTDCDTGRQTPVASDMLLERGYLAARSHDGQAVLVVMQAHFITEANPDTGAPVVTIKLNGQQRFMGDKDCKDLPRQQPDGQ